MDAASSTTESLLSLTEQLRSMSLAKYLMADDAVQDLYFYRSDSSIAALLTQKRSECRHGRKLDTPRCYRVSVSPWMLSLFQKKRIKNYCQAPGVVTPEIVTVKIRVA